jgi:hypothetical protein
MRMWDFVLILISNWIKDPLGFVTNLVRFWLHQSFISSLQSLHDLRVEAGSARARGARDRVTRRLDTHRWLGVAGGERGAAGRRAPRSGVLAPQGHTSRGFGQWVDAGPRQHAAWGNRVGAKLGRQQGFGPKAKGNRKGFSIFQTFL